MSHTRECPEFPECNCGQDAFLEVLKAVQTIPVDRAMALVHVRAVQSRIAEILVSLGEKRWPGLVELVQKLTAAEFQLAQPTGRC